MPTEFIQRPTDTPRSSYELELRPGSSASGVVEQARDAAAEPSALEALLADPTVPPPVPKKHHHKHKKPSRSPHSGRHFSPAMISIALAEEERHSERLKDVLDTTSDRLEYEVQRADEVTARAEYAEVRAKDCFTKLSLTESARDTAERELSRSREDEARYRVQVVELQAALKRLQDDFAKLRDQKMEAEVKAERASEAAREAQTALLSSQAMEAGRLEGFQVGMLKQLNEEKDQMCDEAYADGYEDGKHAGFAAGVKAGRKEGLRDGREQGRREERQNSLRAFDKFVNEEMDEADSDGTRSEWTRRWAESVYHQTTPRRSPGPALFRP